MSHHKNIFTFTWKIENFSMLPHQKGEDLSSPYFEIDMDRSMRWYLVLYPRGEYHSEEGYMALYLKKTSTDISCLIKYDFKLVSYFARTRRIFKKATITSAVGSPNFFNLNTARRGYDYVSNDILTIRCDVVLLSNLSVVNPPTGINECESLKYYLSNCTFRTSTRVHRRNLTWPIKNIREILMQQQQEVSIELESSVGYQPSLMLSLKFEKIDGDDHIRIDISQTDFTCKKYQVFMKGKISVIGADNKYQKSIEASYLFKMMDYSDVWHFPLEIKTSELTHDKYLYLDDTLLLHCEFAFTHSKDVDHFESNQMPFCFVNNNKKRRIENDLGSSIENLHKMGKFCDVSLKAGDQTFPAYKLLLCARSSVFTAMFENDMKEKNSNVVEISDIEPSTLEKMLTFINTDTLDEDLEPKDACKLYTAADKYDIDILKRKLVILLASKLSVYSVWDVLRLASVHKERFLMNAAHNYIRGAATETFKSDSWDIFMEESPELSRDIMHRWITGDFFNCDDD